MPTETILKVAMTSRRMVLKQPITPKSRRSLTAQIRPRKNLLNLTRNQIQSWSQQTRKINRRTRLPRWSSTKEAVQMTSGNSKTMINLNNKNKHLKISSRYNNSSSKDKPNPLPKQTKLNSKQ